VYYFAFFLFLFPLVALARLSFRYIVDRVDFGLQRGERLIIARYRWKVDREDGIF